VIHANNEHGLLIGATTQAGAIVRDVSIVGNTITENDRNETNNNGILLTEVSGGTTENIIIVGNRIGDRHAIPTQNRAISITSGVSTVTISDNDFEDNVAAAAISDTGAVATIRNNRGFITESSGTATIPSAATSTTVTHGLAVTPAADDCSVTATNDLGTAAQFWTSGFGASNFTINVDTDPGASTATFAWTCQVL
jgi:hypothetical protein